MLRNGVCSINNINNEPKMFELVWFLCYCCVKMTSGRYKVHEGQDVVLLAEDCES